jgi:hypothetical protein
VIGYIPERDEATGKEIWPRGDEGTWKKGLANAPPTDDDSISNSIVRHVQTVRVPIPVLFSAQIYRSACTDDVCDDQTLARQAYNLDNVRTRISAIAHSSESVGFN